MNRSIATSLTLAVLAAGLAGCGGFPDKPLYAGIPVSDPTYRFNGNSFDTPTSRLLTDRVLTQFPIGSAEAGLMAWLGEQDMKVERYNRDGGASEGVASRVDRPGPCSFAVRVLWKADAQQRITEVKSDYGSTTCL